MSHFCLNCCIVGYITSILWDLGDWSVWAVPDESRNWLFVFFKKLRFLVWSASNIKTQTLINIRETNMMQSLIHIPILMVVKLGRMWVIISNKNNGCSFISMLKSQLVCVSAIVPRREIFMMTSSNGNIFRVTSHLCRESTGHRWIPRPKASDAGLWCFLWSAPEWRLSKQSWGWWFETPSRPLWRHSNV